MWSPQPALGGALWSGNQTLATTRQVLSTSTELQIDLLSTSLQLQNEINSIVIAAAGFVSTATTDLNMNSFSVLNTKTLSSQNLNVSSIKGANINIGGLVIDNSVLNANTLSSLNLNVSSINGANINVGGIVINNGGNITNNNTTTSGDTKSKTYTASDIVTSAGAAIDTITESAEALGGVFASAQTAAQVASVAYGVGTIANGVQAVNGVVDLTTKAASLFTTRIANTISGPAGPPGQSVPVYETINGTTQFQFSTLNSLTFTVFRTTDKTNPNQLFGNEIYISTIIVPGTKCVRSVSDPLQFVIISTQLRSTNNFLQSYGQWAPILAPEFNLNISTLTADNIFTTTLSSSRTYLSSINDSIRVSSSNLSNVGQFQANNGIFSNAILVTNNAQVGSLTSLGAVSGTSGSFSGNVGANNLTATSAVNGATAVFSGSVSGGSFFTLNNTQTGSLTVTTSAGVGSLTVTNAAGVGSLTVTNAAGVGSLSVTGAAALGSLSVTGLTTLATQNATTINTSTLNAIQISTGNALISSIKGVNIDNILNPTSSAGIPDNLSTLTFSTGSAQISSINGFSFASLLNPAATVFSTASTFLQLFTSSLIASNINTNALQTNQLTTSSLQGLNISTGAGFINQLTTSSIQGLNISTGSGVINQLTTSSIQGTNISTGSGSINQLTISSLIASYISTNVGFINQLNTSSIRAQNISSGVLQTGIFSASTITSPLNYSLISTVANQGDIAGINTTLLKSFISLTSPVPLLNLTNQGGVPQVFNDSNFSYWNQCAFQAGTGPPDVYAATLSVLVVNTAGQVDFYAGSAFSIQINYPGGSTLIGSFSSGFPGQARFTFAAGVWTFTNSFSGGSVTNSNNFQLSQNVSETLLQTTDSFVISTALLDIRAPTNFQTLIAQQFNASTISSINTNSGNIRANVITTSNLNATNITNTNTTTTNVTASNLFASNITTSSLNIRTGLSSFITANFSNNFVLNTYTNPPNVNVGLLTSQLQTFSSNPSFTYSGTAGTDVITLDSSNRVWLNTTLQNTATIGWFLTTITATTGVRLNISTISGVQNNYSASQQIANLVATTAAPLAVYTSAAGFIGNIQSFSVTLQWTGTDYNTTTFAPFTGINFINNTSLSQSISTFTLATTSNIQFNSGAASNVPSISFGGRTVEVFRQRLDGFVTNAGNFGKGDANATIVSPFGQTFPVSQYNCIVTQSAVNIYQQYSLALGEQAWTTLADGNGNWKLQFNLTTPTIPAAYNPNFYAIAGVTMIPYDLGHFSGFQQPTNLGDGFGPPAFFGEIQLSTVITSTITLLAQDNISLLAGIAVPAYIGTGNILVGGTNSVELVGDQTVVGGLTDVNIAALNGSLYLTGNSTIQMAASTISMKNYVDISGALFAPQVLGLSSINGSPFSGGGGWVGTATSDLDMANYNILNVSSIINSNAIRITAGDGFLNMDDASKVTTLVMTSASAISAVGIASDGVITLLASDAQVGLSPATNSGNINLNAANTINIIADSFTYGISPGAGTVNIEADVLWRVRAPDINIEDTTGNIINFGSNLYDSFTNIGDQRVKYGTVSGSNIFTIRNITGDIDLEGSNVTRTLSATQVGQPVIQYGEASSSGSSGSVVVTLPVAYTSAASYVAFVSMLDADPAEMSVVRNTSSEIEIFWQSAGGGSHTVGWNTMGQ